MTTVINPAAPASSSAVPQVLAASFTVTTNTQVVYVMDIDLQGAAGDLIVNGILQGVR